MIEGMPKAAPNEIFTTIDRDILKNPRVKAVCICNGKKWVIPVERYITEYKAIANQVQYELNGAYDYLPITDTTHKKWGFR